MPLNKIDLEHERESYDDKQVILTPKTFCTTIEFRIDFRQRVKIVLEIIFYTLVCYAWQFLQKLHKIYMQIVILKLSKVCLGVRIVWLFTVLNQIVVMVLFLFPKASVSYECCIEPNGCVFSVVFTTCGRGQDRLALLSPGPGYCHEFILFPSASISYENCINPKGCLFSCGFKTYCRV